MTKLKLLTIAVVSLLLVNISLLAFLYLRKPPHPSGDMSRRRVESPKNIIIERLHFDKEQAARYEKLIEQHQQSVKELSDKIRITKNQLYSTLATDAALSKDSLQNKLGEIQRQIESIHYNHFADIKKLCNPKQLDLFNELTLDLAKYFAPGKKLNPRPGDRQ